MNPAPVSPHLIQERARLLNVIAQIRAAGRVAPAYCWLTETSSTKGNRTYTYARLVAEIPGEKITYTSLGKLGGEQHRAWERAIRRRELIGELEQQLKLLAVLIDRQGAMLIEVPKD